MQEQQVFEKGQKMNTASEVCVKNVMEKPKAHPTRDEIHDVSIVNSKQFRIQTIFANFFE